MQPLFLMTPERSMLPPRVALAVSREMATGPRAGSDKVMAEVTGKLQSVLQTGHNLLIAPGSEEGVWEGAVTNFFSPADRVVCTVMGEKGRQWSDAAAAHGLDVVRLGCEWGRTVTACDIGLFLDSVAGEHTRGVLVTHHEPSTGVYAELASIGEVCRSHEVLFLVDAVHSLGTLPLMTDQWKIDVVISATPGALPAPAGLGLFCISPRAWEANRRAGCPRYALDLARLNQEKCLPCGALLTGMGEALDMIREEGLERVFERLRWMARMFRRGVEAMGMELLVPDEAMASPAVTTIIVPEQVTAGGIAALMEESGVLVGRGMAQFAKRMIRVGHWNPVSTSQVVATLASLGWACRIQGVAVNLEAALAAAWEVYRDE